MSRKIEEFFVRLKYQHPIDGRQGCSVIVGAETVKRGKELALIGQPAGTRVLDIWKPAEDSDG